MADLKSIINDKWEDLDRTRKSNSVKDLPTETLRTYAQKIILEYETVSRWIDSEGELNHLTDKLFNNMPPLDVIGNLNGYVAGVMGLGITLLLDYGVPIEDEDLQDREFHHFADWGRTDEGPQDELRVFPDHPRTEEIIGRNIKLYKRIMEAQQKEGRFSGIGYLTSGFDDWRSAIVFANHSHRWTSKSNRKKILGRKIAEKNDNRFQRFGLTSYEAIKNIKPGEIFQVENVFGEAGGRYINGDIKKFKILSYYANIKGAKKDFKEMCCQNGSMLTLDMIQQTYKANIKNSI